MLIKPTPPITGVGLINKLTRPIGHNFKNNKSVIMLVGKTFGHLEQSCFLKENYSITDGMPPEVNLLNEKNNGENILKLIQSDLVLSSHDISNGGLIIALCEMALSTNYGVKIQKPKKLTNLFKYFFGEDQGRYILEIDPKALPKVEKLLKFNNVYYENIGLTQKDYFEIESELKINVKDLYKANNEWYSNY